MLSFSSVVSVVEGQFGRKGDAATREREEDHSAPERPQPALFQCPDCESVYVAVDKQRCTTCETAVEQVPSTLSRTQ